MTSTCDERIIDSYKNAFYVTSFHNKIWLITNKSLLIKVYSSEISFINWVIISFFRKISLMYYNLLKTDSIW